jgi:UPF0755 protein
MARLGVIIFVLLVVGATAAVGYVMLGDDTPILGPALGNLTDPMAPVARDDGALQVFTVRSGTSAAEIGEELQRRNLVRSGLVFRFVVEQEGVGNNLVAGDYELSRSMSTQEIVQVLARGKVKRGLIATIPEGWRIEQIADRLEATGVASREEFLQAVASPGSVPGVDALGEPAPPSLEGYLFPETYEVRERVSGTQAAELMVRMFATRVGAQVRRGQPEAKLSPHQVLTVASIVEREAQQASERPTIASVYLNRILRDMPLQADPTVQYALANQDTAAARAFAYWKRDLTEADLRLPSPFNTYVNAGLPPAPICNPGEDSIKAVLEPAKTDFLYFVARTDGSGTHLFARTLDEHNANVARVGR